MSDLISRSALIEDLNKKSSYDLVCFDTELLGIINDQPTIEAVPVVYGEWIKDLCPEGLEGYANWKCSKCNKWVRRRSNFCPNCGCRMKEGAE